MADAVPVPLEDFLQRRAGLRVPPRTAAQRAVSAVAGPLTNVLGAGLDALIIGQAQQQGRPLAESTPVSREGAHAIAESVVPQTPVQVGAAAGTLAAGLFTGGMAPLAAAGTRVLGATVGGGLSGLTEGQSPMEAAGTGGWQGLLTSAGEAVGFGVGKLWRATATGRRMAASTDRDLITKEIGAHVPGLDAVPDAATLKRLVKSRAATSPKSQMDQVYSDALTNIEGRIGHHALTVPTLGPTPMSLREAVEQLKVLGQAGFGGAKDVPANRTFVGSAARGDWKQAIGEIKGELNRYNPTGEAARDFDKARTTWSTGNTFLRILSDESAIRGHPNYVEVDLNAVRRGYEKAYSKFERALTSDEREAFEKVLYRGGPFGSRDVVPGQPGMGAAVGQLLRQGGGTATAGVLPLRTLLPNLGAQYTGQPPFTLPPAAQTGLDLLLQRAGGAGGLSGPPLP